MQSLKSEQGIPYAQNDAEMEDEFDSLDLIDDSFVRELDLLESQVTSQGLSGITTSSRGYGHLQHESLGSGVGVNGSISTGSLERPPTNVLIPQESEIYKKIAELEKLNEDLRSKLQSKEGEVAIIRTNFQKLKSEKDQIKSSMNKRIEEERQEHERFKAEMKRQTEIKDAETQFKTKELESIIERHEIQARRTLANSSLSNSVISEPGRKSSKVKDITFPSFSTFVQPTQATLMAKQAKSVAVMTDKSLITGLLAQSLGPQQVNANVAEADTRKGLKKDIRRREPLSKMDERLLLMQRLLTELFTTEEMTRSCTNKNTLPNFVAESLIGDHFIKELLPDEKCSHDVQARFQGLASELLACIASSLSFGISETMQNLLDINAKFFGLCLATRSYSIMKKLIRLLGILVFSYSYFRKLLINKCLGVNDETGLFTNSQEIHNSNIQSTSFCIIHCLFMILRKYVTDSTTSVHPSEQGLESREAQIESTIDDNDIMTTLQILQVLVWDCDKNTIKKFQSLTIQDLLSGLLDVGVSVGIVINTVKLIRVLIADDKLLESYLLVENDSNQSLIEKTILFLEEKPSKASIDEAASLKLVVVQLLSFTFARSCEGRPTFILAVEAVPQLILLLNTEIQTLIGNNDQSINSLTPQLIIETTQLVHLCFRIYPQIYDHIEKMSTYHIFIVVLARLCSADKEGLSALKELSDLARDLLDGLIIPDDNEETVMLFKGN